MQRFKQPGMDLHPDGEWIRYEDHCEAMKRIAAHPAGEAQPPVWIQADHLEHAKRGAFMCRVEATYREGMGFVPLYAAPPSSDTGAPIASPAALTDAMYRKLYELIELQSEGEWDDALIKSDARKFCDELMPIILAASQADKEKGNE